MKYTHEYDRIYTDNATRLLTIKHCIARRKHGLEIVTIFAACDVSSMFHCQNLINEP